jgi:hypothetical protein
MLHYCICFEQTPERKRVGVIYLENEEMIVGGNVILSGVFYEIVEVWTWGTAWCLSVVEP